MLLDGSTSASPPDSIFTSQSLLIFTSSLCKTMALFPPPWGETPPTTSNIQQPQGQPRRITSQILVLHGCLPILSSCSPIYPPFLFLVLFPGLSLRACHCFFTCAAPSLAVIPSLFCSSSSQHCSISSPLNMLTGCWHMGSTDDAPLPPKKHFVTGSQLFPACIGAGSMKKKK